MDASGLWATAMQCVNTIHAMSSLPALLTGAPAFLASATQHCPVCSPCTVLWKGQQDTGPIQDTTLPSTSRTGDKNLDWNAMLLQSHLQPDISKEGGSKCGDQEGGGGGVRGIQD